MYSRNSPATNHRWAQEHEFISPRVLRVADSNSTTPAGHTSLFIDETYTCCHSLMILCRSRRPSYKKKYVDKPCPRFTTTGAHLSNWTSSPPHPAFRFFLTTSTLWNRFLQSWPHMRLQARPSQNRNMLALSSEQLSAYRRDLCSLA